jgi:lipopolysaccharide export system protein LptC
MSPPQLLPEIPEVIAPRIELASAMPDDASAKATQASWPWHARWWDRMSLYLPLIMMAVLALGTWWLLQSAPGGALPASEAKPSRGIPDYVMSGFELRRFDEQGQLRARLLGERLSHWSQGDRLHLQGVSLSVWDAAGGSSQASAQQAQTAQSLERIELSGGVRLQQQWPDAAPTLQLRGEGLTLRADRAEITSEKPVELEQGRSRIEAARLRLDYRQRVLELSGGVQTRIDVAGSEPLAP